MRLNDHFEIHKNVPCQGSVFHKADEESGESNEQFATRLGEFALHCE